MTGPCEYCRTLILSIVLAGFSALAGCSGGIAEFQLFEQAFDAQFDQGNKVLDRVATAERKVFLRQQGRTVGLSAFDPDDAAYYLQSGDPPLTGAIRASLKSVRSYNKALSGLVNGEAARALSNRVGTISSNLLVAASSLQVAAGGSSGALTGGGQAIINRLLPVFEPLTTLANRSAFRRQLLAAYPDMRALLVTLRAGTEDMYDVIRRSYVQRGKLGVGRDGIPSAERPRLERDRALMAGWVVLIDRSLVAMDAAAEAALRGASTTDVASLAETALELRVLAEKIKDTQTDR